MGLRMAIVEMLGAVAFSHAFQSSHLVSSPCLRVVGQSVHSLSAAVTSSSVEKKRLFVAVELNNKDKLSLDKAMDHFRSLPGSSCSVLKWIKPDNLHITLKFLGDTPVADIPALKASLAEHLRDSALPPFSLSESGCGYFERRGVPSVLWLGLSADTQRSLRSLSSAVDRACVAVLPPSSSSSSRDFAAHITLARTKLPRNPLQLPPAQRKALAALTQELQAAAHGVPSLSTDVHGITLFESDLRAGPRGPVYSPVGVFELAEAKPQSQPHAQIAGTECDAGQQTSP